MSSFVWFCEHCDSMEVQIGPVEIEGCLYTNIGWIEDKEPIPTPKRNKTECTHSAEPKSNGLNKA